MLGKIHAQMLMFIIQFHKQKVTMLIIPLTMAIGIVFLFLPVACIYAKQAAVTPYFSVEVPNGWVYRENFGYKDHILLTPNEFADYLIGNNASALVLGGLKNSGSLIDLVHDLNFPVKNAPLEIYAKQFLARSNHLSPKFENVTIGGESAIKVFIRGTDVGNASARPNITGNLNFVTYFVMHHDEPYHLDYIANMKDFQKYLPQFKQMVKTFKFLE
jgi:hypothetical protein